LSGKANTQTNTPIKKHIFRHKDIANIFVILIILPNCFAQNLKLLKNFGGGIMAKNNFSVKSNLLFSIGLFSACVPQLFTINYDVVLSQVLNIIIAFWCVSRSKIADSTGLGVSHQNSQIIGIFHRQSLEWATFCRWATFR
jgi:hypothetical membrane protein